MYTISAGLLHTIMSSPGIPHALKYSLVMGGFSCGIVSRHIAIDKILNISAHGIYLYKYSHTYCAKKNRPFSTYTVPSKRSNNTIYNKYRLSFTSRFSLILFTLSPSLTCIWSINTDQFFQQISHVEVKSYTKVNILCSFPAAGTTLCSPKRCSIQKGNI